MKFIKLLPLTLQANWFLRRLLHFGRLLRHRFCVWILLLGGAGGPAREERGAEKPAGRLLRQGARGADVPRGVPKGREPATQASDSSDDRGDGDHRTTPRRDGCDIPVHPVPFQLVGGGVQFLLHLRDVHRPNRSDLLRWRALAQAEHWRRPGGRPLQHLQNPILVRLRLRHPAVAHVPRRSGGDLQRHRIHRDALHRHQAGLQGRAGQGELPLRRRRGAHADGLRPHVHHPLCGHSPRPARRLLPPRRRSHHVLCDHLPVSNRGNRVDSTKRGTFVFFFYKQTFLFGNKNKIWRNGVNCF